MALEQTRLKLGFVPLCDCAPLIVAKERGFFALNGLEVELLRQASWATVRDRLAVDALDGSQMLATMPISATLGLGNVKVPLVTPLVLNLGGNAITLSTELYERMTEADPVAMAGNPAQALKVVIEQDKTAGREPMTFAMVYPFSTHNYVLRYWMAAGGIDPDRDVRLVVVPPPQMVANLSAGAVDGYCVGEPWGSLAENLGLGRRVATSNDIFAGLAEKVLGVREAWADENPESLKALLKSVLMAAMWADEPHNRQELAEILAKPRYLNIPVEVAHAALGAPVNIAFHRHAANFPWRSQALWFLTQMRRWRHLPAGVNLRHVAAQTWRPDLYRPAAHEIGLAVPLDDLKTEGSHPGPWVLSTASRPIMMGADTLCDGAVFDPATVERPATTNSQSSFGA